MRLGGWDVRTFLRLVAVVIAASVLLAACGGGNGGTEVAGGSAELPDAESDDAVAGAPQDLPDACLFLTHEEISTAVGRELGEGEPQTMVEGMSECRFKTATGMEATESYDDPVIPETALGSVTVAVNASNPEEFDLFEESLGAEAEAVSGIGDDAYFWGSNLLYVRVGERGFSIRIDADGADEQRMRDAILVLAEAGVERL